MIRNYSSQYTHFFETVQGEVENGNFCGEQGERKVCVF